KIVFVPGGSRQGNPERNNLWIDAKARPASGAVKGSRNQNGERAELHNMYFRDRRGRKQRFRRNTSPQDGQKRIGYGNRLPNPERVRGAALMVNGFLNDGG